MHWALFFLMALLTVSCRICEVLQNFFIAVLVTTKRTVGVPKILPTLFGFLSEDGYFVLFCTLLKL